MSEIHNEAMVIQKAFSNKYALTIFDVGACNFLDSLFLRKHFPFASIYAFEPDVTNLRQLPAALIDAAQINVVPVALSNLDDLIKFYPSTHFEGHEYKGSGSTLRPVTKPGTSEGIYHDTLLFDLDGYDIQSIRIDTFCRLNGIGHIDYLHIDVQGAEMKVIEGLGDFRPSFIFAETCEFSAYESNTTLDRFNAYMVRLGYEIVKEFRDDTLYKLKSIDCDFSSHHWLPKL